MSFGWRYDFNGGELTKTEDMPGFLAYARVKAERFAALAPGKLQQALVTEYSVPPSAGTRTAPSSAMSSGCRSFPLAPFAFAKKAAAGWERRSLIAEPRSIYLLRGPCRIEWEHSIPGVDSLRYSITFRNVLKRTA